jgi:hypothetical protein
MMAPYYYREARLRARDHIAGRIVERHGSMVHVRITNVFRGRLRVGSVVRLHVSLADESGGPPELAGRINIPAAVIAAAPFVEAFLDGDPPDVVMDQIKFLAQRPSRPSGDPTIESYLW